MKIDAIPNLMYQTTHLMKVLGNWVYPSAFMVGIWTQYNSSKYIHARIVSWRTNGVAICTMVSFGNSRPACMVSGTMGLWRLTGCKVASCQSWRFEKNSASRSESNYSRVAWGQLLDNGIIFQLWQLITLQPVDLQIPTVPFWKDLNPAVNILSD